MRKSVFVFSYSIRYKLGCSVSIDGFTTEENRNCTIYVAKTKSLNRCVDTAQLSSSVSVFLHIQKQAFS